LTAKRKIQNGLPSISVYNCALIVLVDTDNMELFILSSNLSTWMPGIENNCSLWKKVVTAELWSISKKEESSLFRIEISTTDRPSFNNIKPS